ncbi:hypothetical protein PE067_14030 [Paracoccus sp. DMF-8]|uniref:hypothetical protein n=1 Tax=Paracoccus sp. DMF-8 TaxID=3019445 RepID=UPI0023E88023|nr:hypothetical protein [Paracoccus sp. DMF-8]MDF3607154.1 hypothetical protein [Paracoccus sp. DMF-8]
MQPADDGDGGADGLHFANGTANPAGGFGHHFLCVATGMAQATMSGMLICYDFVNPAYADRPGLTLSEIAEDTVLAYDRSPTCISWPAVSSCWTMRQVFSIDIGKGQVRELPCAYAAQTAATLLKGLECFSDRTRKRAPNWHHPASGGMLPSGAFLEGCPGRYHAAFDNGPNPDGDVC